MSEELFQRHVGSDAGAVVECRLLGGFDLAGGPAPEALKEVCNRPKLIGLFSYLLLAGRETAVSRDVLLAMFWPDSSQLRAQQSLRQSLHLLRRACGQDAVAARGSRMQLNRARFRVDGYDLMAASARGDHQAVVQNYQGELLRGIHVSGCLEFERWLEEERSRIHQLALAAARDWARAEQNAGNPVGALHPLRRALTLAPYDEDLIAALVTTLFRLRSRAEAASELQRFTARFRADLELEPGSETLGLLDRLMTEPPVAGARPPIVADPDPVQADAEEWSAEARAVTADHPALEAVPRPRTGERWVRVAAAVAVVAVAMVAAMSFPAGRRDAIGVGHVVEERRVVVVPFLNLSGDPQHDVLGFLAADRIADALARSGLEVVPPVASLLEAPTIADTGLSSRTLGNSTGFTLAREVGAAHLISGVLRAAGKAIELQVYVFDVARRTLRVPRLGEAVPPGDPLPAIAAIETRITATLAGLGDERLAAWVGAASQPPSLEVYEAFAASIASYALSDSTSAARFLAVAAMDTSFTAPLVWAMLAELFSDRIDAADRVIQTLLPRREHLPPWDRAMLDWGAATVRGDLRARAEAVARLTTLVPESFWVGLAVGDALDRKLPRVALGHLARMGPDRVWYGQPWGNYFRASAAAHHMLGNYRAELDILSEWRAREDLPPPPATIEAGALAGLHRTTELSLLVNRLLAEARQPLSLTLADELAGHGHDSLARHVHEQRLAAFDAAEAGSSGAALDAGIGRARSLIRLARLAEGRAVVERLLQFPGDLEGVLRGDLGRIAGLQGDVATARAQADWFTKQETRHSGGWFTAKRAQIAAALGDRVELLRLMAQAEQEGWIWAHDQQFSPEYTTFQTDPDFLAFFRPRG